ncbi:hypothetical protein [Sphingomonas hengshuiensis]|uniref:Uncharacterized protein n=1 Tax=Sphingomonas hengshuiensis TaxID=1609977 RepID=A0A7U5BFS2_9SPHN|nr:hypothetical protein [Sphingomonas hengshuiensis]AJP74454.1 hypothetical protein TS85_11400 [Sphingomonas hengshuiensis]
MTDGRGLPAELETEIAAPVLRPFLAPFIDTPDPVRAFTGKGTLTFDGHDWTGIEGVASIEPGGESTSGSASGLKCTLLRVPAEFREDLADQAVRGCAYELHFGALDETHRSVIGTKRIWKGTLQGYDIIDDGTELSVTATGESRMIDQRRVAVKRFTDEYQQRKHPGDRFFEYAAAMTEVSVLWAKAAQS